MKGHQDDVSHFAALDRWARLNVEMDKRAKQHIGVARRSPRHYLVEYKPWSLWLHGTKIIQDLSTTVYDLIHADLAKEYWKIKDNTTREVIDSVNWDAISIAMKETKRSRRVFFI